jgi:hypothetical protein
MGVGVGVGGGLCGLGWLLLLLGGGVRLLAGGILGEGARGGVCSSWARSANTR